MGMFSTVTHNGREYQFKTGFDDDLGHYKLGDVIPWRPDPYWPGSHIDGVHDGCSGLDRSIPDVWVVVKGCKIIAVEPKVDPLTDCIKLREYHCIGRPDPKLWTKEQWKAKRKREAESKAKYRAWAKIHGDNPAAYYIHCMMNEKSFAETLFPIKKVKL